jgi:hypothetical protein
MSRFQRVIRRLGQDEIRSNVQFERESGNSAPAGRFFPASASARAVGAGRA